MMRRARLVLWLVLATCPGASTSFAAESSAHTNPPAIDDRARQSEAPERRDEWPGSLVKWVGTLGATALLLRTLRRR